MSALQEHLESGVTTLARCWAVIRRDGVIFGFTDHDRPLDFNGITFRADSGMTARAIMSASGLAVDNSEAMGALSDAAITEADIEAGRFDGAEVKAWLVNWADVEMRSLRFAGSIGELRRSGGAFHAELRGLTERLNRPQGRVYQTPCSAILGDGGCQFDLSTDGYSVDVAVQDVLEDRKLAFEDLSSFEPAWFERGRLEVLSGAAAGLVAVIKRDRFVGSTRLVEVWEAFRAPLVPGDTVRLQAGCDKRFTTCRLKFDNAMNYQGFPDIPGDDWLMAVPTQGGTNQGGSLRRDG